jgi:hypothetical protein
MKHVPFSPNLYTIFDTFNVMIHVTFESEGNANRPFLLHVDVAGDGSSKTNIFFLSFCGVGVGEGADGLWLIIWNTRTNTKSLKDWFFYSG